MSKKKRIIFTSIGTLFILWLFSFVFPVIPSILEDSLIDFMEKKYNDNEIQYEYTPCEIVDKQGRSYHTCKLNTNQRVVIYFNDRHIPLRCFWRIPYAFNNRFATEGYGETASIDFPKDAFKRKRVYRRDGCRSDLYYAFIPKKTGDFIITKELYNTVHDSGVLIHHIKVVE